MKQVTCAILKPSLFARKDSLRVKKCVLQIAKDNGLRPVATKFIEDWPRTQAERFYEIHRGKFYYSRLVFTMSNGPIEVIAFEGENAVQKWRDIMGPTRIEVRKTHPHTLRGMFSRSDTKNILHGSDSTGNATSELRFFFPEEVAKHNEVHTAEKSS